MTEVTIPGHPLLGHKGNQKLSIMKLIDKDYKDAINDVLTALGTLVATMIICILIGILMSGCTTTKYVPVESVTTRTDTCYYAKLRVDSVKFTQYIHESDNRYDSVAPILDSLNRVIGWDRYHFRETTKMNNLEMKKLRMENDSLKSVKRDSVEKQIPYPVEKIVEVVKPLAWWQSALMWWGVIASVAIGYLIYKTLKHK